MLSVMIYTDPLRDVQQEEPVTRCPKCGGEIWSGEPMFDWNNGGFVCLDYFKSSVSAFLESDPRLAAVEMGVEYKEV